MPRVVLDIDKRVPTKQPHGNFGSKHTPERCANMSAGQLGKKQSTEACAKKRAARLGKKHAPETLAKVIAALNRPETRAKLRAANLSKKLTAEHAAKLRAANLGREQTPAHKAKNSAGQRRRFPIGTRQCDTDPRIRSSEVAAWARAVYARDNFSCQHCAARGVKLNAHHIKPWKKFPEHRFDIDNGVTLCTTCHGAEHRALNASAKRSSLHKQSFLHDEAHAS